VQAILVAGHIPAGMELFTAGDQTQMEVIKRWIDESDIYMLILGARYGSIEAETGKSYTQLEYEYAVEKGLPFFALVIDQKKLEKQAAKNKSSEADNPLYQGFRSLVSSRMVQFWEDDKDIKIQIPGCISKIRAEREVIGWVRGDNANTVAITEELARLSKENSELRTLLGNTEDKIFDLTYEQFFEKLKEETFELPYKERKINLYDYLKTSGDMYTDICSNQNDDASIRLKRFGLIEVVASQGAFFQKFNELGQRVYTKIHLASPHTK
jgi:hypothetical protein